MCRLLFIPHMPDITPQALASIWTPNQHKLMLWLATPSELRMPLTEKALAEELSVNPATFWKWKQKPEFRKEVQQLITDSLADDYHDVMDAFKKQARAGSFPHQRMYFEMLGVYTEKRQIDLNFIRDEIAALAEDMGLDKDEVMAEAQGILKGSAV